MEECGDNEYNGGQVAQSIIDCTLQAVLLFMILFNQRSAIEAAGQARMLLGRKSEIMSEVKEAYESDITNTLLMRLFNGNAIHSPGWYFGNDRHISISGGPKYVPVDDEEVSYKIDSKTINTPFVIKDRECDQ